LEHEHEALSEEICINVTGVVHIGPCILHGIIVAGKAADGDAQLHDSVNANGELRFDISCVSKTTFGWRSTDGILLHKGIHITVNAATTFVMIEYHPIKLGAAGRIIVEA